VNTSRRPRRDAVDRPIELLDIEAALMRVDRRNSFELVTISPDV
jgi:hypothetical protein